tara:strand:+ start:196 stop:666 length:471 start_codon:yes stop_codon:yes gene_type:complete
MFNNNKKFTNLKEYLLENFLLGKLSTHGPCHWDRVLKNGLLIAKEDPNIDKLIIILFSYIHDSKRIDEYKDAKHGERAAASIEELEKLKLINISNKQKEILHFAVKNHNLGYISKNPTIGACWDADRLELNRVGIFPSPEFFSTKDGLKILLERFY